MRYWPKLELLSKDDSKMLIICILAYLLLLIEILVYDSTEEITIGVAVLYFFVVRRVAL